MSHPLRWHSVLLLGFALVALASFGGGLAGCGREPSAFDSDGGDVDAAVDPDAEPSLPDAGSPEAGALVVTPDNQKLNVTVGGVVPTLAFHAFLEGVEIKPTWTVDRAEVALIGTASGILTPTATTGGTAHVIASYQGKTGIATFTVHLDWTENGDPKWGQDAGGGSGGNGGVGGEGAGPAVDPGTKAVLEGSPTSDPSLSWLYPYDKTVWPRGVLAPLLQWTAASSGTYDAVYLHVVEDNLDYKGYFGKTATPFVHHPIPQAVWKAIGSSNDGEDVKISLVLAKGNAAVGPISETWKVARGALKGTVYYNSYGTNLAQNFQWGNKTFGAATLAVKGASTQPTLVAGSSTSNGCRACHSVASDGSRLVTQRGDNYNASAVVSLPSLSETTLASGFAKPALYPDGTRALSDAMPLAGGVPGGASALFALPGGAPISATGLPSGFGAGSPSFSADGSRVAFNFYAGPGSDKRSLAMLSFSKNTSAFSGLTTLWTPPSGAVVYPTFLPTGDGIVFELETVSNGRYPSLGETRASCDPSSSCGDAGTRAELWWLDLKTKTAHRLDALNGVGYVPQGPNGHGADATLNYEPTVSPIVSGGYAWVVFTSRRMYGNVATVNPYWSDPRFYPIDTVPTTKKLWVAAIDLNAPPGTDPSHPAFYVPGQELLAGNAQGVFVADACKASGQKCEGGDECCDGYCGQDGLCTSTKPLCAPEFDKCATSSDCCNTTALVCINGRCAAKGPN